MRSCWRDGGFPALVPKRAFFNIYIPEYMCAFMRLCVRVYIHIYLRALVADTGSDWGGPFGICGKFPGGSKVEVGQLPINTGVGFCPAANK